MDQILWIVQSWNTKQLVKPQKTYFIFLSLLCCPWLEEMSASERTRQQGKVCSIGGVRLDRAFAQWIFLLKKVVSAISVKLQRCYCNSKLFCSHHSIRYVFMWMTDSSSHSAKISPHAKIPQISWQPQNSKLVEKLWNWKIANMWWFFTIHLAFLLGFRKFKCQQH